MSSFSTPTSIIERNEYGGTIEGRNRFALDIARACVTVIGADKVGIRLSPHGVLGGTGAFPEVDAQYLALTHSLSSMGLVYVHLLDHSALGTPPVPDATKKSIRQSFNGTMILAGGFDKDSAEAALEAGRTDLIAFGRLFIANPDLAARLQKGAPMNPLDPSTFYTPGQAGYTDYPRLEA